jgi:hypothetical protein
MSFHVLPFGSRPTAGTEPPGAPGELVDLASRRMDASEVTEIPEHVLDEVAGAAMAAEELRRSNREVRFEPDAGSGRIVASLCELGGGVVRALPLREVFGPGPDGPSAAA